MTDKNNDITLALDIEQVGEIKVHSQIINDLSSGIYSSPASCIKELVNNSFDADAQNVIIRMKPIEDSITILDDGNGMNAEDFDNNFAWISKSNKRNRGEFSAAGRPLIGKIGIGFIAVNEICDVLEVVSSKKGEAIKFTARIDFKEILDSKPSKSDDEDTYLKGKFTLVNEKEDKNEHFTAIRLVGLKEPVLKIFNDETYKAQAVKEKNKGFAKLSFKTMKDLLAHHASKSVYSWENDSEYMQFIIDLASYIPVEYIDGGPIEGVKDKTIDEIVSLHKKFNFKVDFDGMYLKKPIYFPKDKNKRAEHTSFKKKIRIGDSDNFIALKGYFYIQNSLLIPRELNGVAIRIKNIPIAERFGFDGTFLRYPVYMEQIFRNWISGELYIEQGLEDAMNIDRKSFRVTHPDYIALQNFLHEYLKEDIFKIAFKLYDDGKNVRDAKKDKVKKDATKRILKAKKVTYSSKPKPATPQKGSKKKKEEEEVSPVKIVTTKNKGTVIEIDSVAKNKFKKSDWEYLQTIFIIFENSFNESRGDAKKLKELFYKKIDEWKAK
ncbi:MAG: hypothetical protein A3F72_10990 [Bacteroidetes bacterium RIFCSPLOWO2_12_FULL_35_15]|nr:MAG: hypothetical protein A3F72_10990 [Bacteroidetes bacterium RIFCSPLOWO2_12_FULL_35_15]